MATAKEKSETGGDVIDASKHQLHKAGDLKELMIAAALDKHAQVDGGHGTASRKSPGVLVLLIMCAGLIVASFLAYMQMLNVQERVDLLTTDLDYEDLVAMSREIGRTSAKWLYFSAASFACGMVFLGAAVVVAFLRPK